MEISLPKGFKITKFQEYKPNYLVNNIIEVETENLNFGRTQVFIMKIQNTNPNEDSKI